MAVLRMDHVSVIVEDLDAAVAFFEELGLYREGATEVSGDWVDQIVGLDGARSRIVMMRTPDGRGGLELTKFLNPPAVAAEPKVAPVNTLGLRTVMFAVDDLDDVLRRLKPHGGELLREVAQYEDLYRLCYVRGPAGILVALAQPLRPGA